MQGEGHFLLRVLRGGVSKERVTLWSGCTGLKALAGFLGQRPKPLGRAHNFGAQRRSYSGLYLGKPSQSRHANGVPLKSCAVRPSVPPGYVGVVHIVNRAVLYLFRAFYGIVFMLSVVIVCDMRIVRFALRIRSVL